MANLRDVAKRASVSLACASRVLAKDETFKVSDETKERIYSVAKELNYVYEHRSRSKNKQKGKIGFILALTSEKYSDPFFTSILSAAEEEGEKLNIPITVIKNYNELSSDDILQEVLAMKLDGILLTEILPNDIFQKLKDNIPHVIAVDPSIPDTNTIGYNTVQTTKLIMEHLISKGNKRIAFIGGCGQNEEFDNTDRLMVYRDELRRHNLKYESSLVKNCKWDFDLCAKYAEELLTSENPPDAIFAGSDTLASVILGIIYSLGLSCPKDVSVIGVNNIPMSAHYIPPLTTVELPSKEMGKVAMRRMYELIETKDTQIMNILLPVKLIERESTNIER